MMERSFAEPDAALRRRICLVLALVTLVIYSPVYFNDFFILDDAPYVTENPVVQQGLTWHGIKWAFTSMDTNWHPLTWLSHMLDCQLFGLNPGPQHIVNVLFHAANAVLLFLLWLRLARRMWLGAFIAAVFAWHPLRVESVAWIAERKDVLSAFFMLLALWFYTGYAQAKVAEKTKSKKVTGAREYVLALVCFVLALLTKPMAVTLPFVFVLLDFWPLGRMPVPKAGVRNLSLLIREKLPFFALTVIFSIVTVIAQSPRAVVALDSYPFSFRLCNAVLAYVRYLGKAIWPAKLAVLYPLPQSFIPWQVASAALVLVVISLLAWRFARQRPWFFVGWFWYLGMLVPVIGLLQVGLQSMADRYTYLPMVGISVVVAFGAAELIARFRLTKVAIATTAVTLLLFIGFTSRQILYWRNSETLWLHTLAVTKENRPAHQSLGMYLYDDHRMRALAEFREALRIADAYRVRGMAEDTLAFQGHFALARDFQRNGQFPEALEQFQILLKQARPSSAILNDFANLLDEMGKTQDALAQYRAAIRLDTNANSPHLNLGTLLLKLGKSDEGMAEYATAARLDPKDARPDYLMGKALLRLGKSAGAIGHFRAALKLKPDDFQTLTLLARTLASDPDNEVRSGPEAVAIAEHANELTKGEQPLVLDTLAMAYAEAGRFSEAQRAEQQAIHLAAAALPEKVSEFRERLKLYQQNETYRESVPDTTVNSTSRH